MRCYISCHQDDWSSWLKLAQFTYKYQPHSSTGKSTFFANFGYHPNTSAVSTSNYNVAADELTSSLSRIHSENASKLKKMSSQYKIHADEHWSDTETLLVNDYVFLNAKNIKSQLPSKKLGPRCLGPFKVSRTIN